MADELIQNTIDHHGGVRSIEKGACVGFVKALVVQLLLKVANQS